MYVCMYVCKYVTYDTIKGVPVNFKDTMIDNN